VSLIILSGPTASGKSGLADLLYNVYPSRIINADSLQIYDALPILTAQPADLKIDNNKYALYGEFHHQEKCSLAKWIGRAVKEIDKTISEGKVAILVGGTGMYIMSLLEGMISIPDIEHGIRSRVKELFEEVGKEKFYQMLLEKDLKVARKVHANDTSRMIRAMEVFEQTGKSIVDFQDNRTMLCKHKYLHVSLFPDRDVLYKNCDDRFEEMIRTGGIEEVREFLGLNQLDQGRYGVECALGYNEIKEFLSNNITLDQAKEKAKQVTRNYAKRQVTWFRNQMPEKQCLYYRGISDIEDEFFHLVDSFVSKNY